MKYLAALFGLLFATQALAQSFPGEIPSGYVYGNSTASSGVPTGASMGAMLDRAFTLSTNGFLTRSGTATFGVTALPLPIASGGTGQVTAAAARSGLGIENRVSFGDTNCVIAATTRTQATNAMLTATRTCTLPAANAVNPGQSISVVDDGGAVNGSNVLIVQRAGSDTLNGSVSITVGVARSGIICTSDGNMAWYCYAIGATGSAGGVTSIGGLSGIVGLDATLTVSGSNIKLATPVAVASGGTNATTAPTARVSLATFGHTSTGSSASTLSVTSADVGKVFMLDATSTSITVTLATAASFGVGQVSFIKTDDTSNLISFVVSGGNTINGRTTVTMPLEKDSFILHSNGTNWFIAGQNFASQRGSILRAEHDVTTLTYNIAFTNNGYLLLVDATTAGGPVLVVLPAMSDACFIHQNYTMAIKKFDAGGNVVSVVPNAADPGTAAWLGGSPFNLNNQYDTVWLWCDGARWVNAIGR